MLKYNENVKSKKYMNVYINRKEIFKRICININVEFSSFFVLKIKYEIKCLENKKDTPTILYFACDNLNNQSIVSN